MKTSHRRIALLTGASFTALGVATPAFAAPHDVAGPGTYAGTNTSATTITLCTIATNATCMFGVVDTGVANATAIVNSTANGRIEQTDFGASIELYANNPLGDFAEIGAVAIASNPAGAANAFASIADDGFRQHAIASTGTAIASLNNDGQLLIDALASAIGTSGAVANAFVNTAISQYAYVTTGSGDALAVIDNDGLLTIEANAFASASAGLAAAIATIDYGVYQGAFNTGSGDAVVTMFNDGQVNVEAVAVALGDNALATANVQYGVYQSATASTGDASVAILNGVNGAIDVGAVAVAVGDSGFADAQGTVQSGIYQSANVSSAGDASVVLSNDGLIDIHATASASATGAATALALVDGGLFQYAFAGSDGNGSVMLDNATGATFDIAANAVAFGDAAFARASISDGISMSATAVGSGNLASANLNNGGNLTIAADASASGTNAVALANVTSGINLAVNGYSSADALAQLNNSGNLAINAHAMAVGTTDGVAIAHMSGGGIDIDATAHTNGDASANVANGGTLSIGVDATAIASGTTSSLAAFASAAMLNSDALAIHASANFGVASVGLMNGSAVTTTTVGGATNVIVNDAALIDIHANAVASAAFGAAVARAVMPAGGIAVTASASGTSVVAENVVANYGVISVQADAAAAGSAAFATATMGDYAMERRALVNSGTAILDFYNAGDIDIAANALATSTRNEAQAVAAINNGALYALAFASTGVVDVALVNEGAIAIHANATAVAETNAVADARVFNGSRNIAQVGSGTVTNQWVNEGTYEVGANALASGNSANAYALVDIGVRDLAIVNTGTANAMITNDGVLELNAAATAIGGVLSATAHAQIINGLQVYGIAGVEGNAAAALNNSGSIAIAASADASGATAGAATATIYRAISATAFATGTLTTAGGALVNGDASVSLANDGAISIQANAVANDTAYAQVGSFTAGGSFSTAAVFLGAFGAGSRDVTLANGGSMDIGAAATGASAVALVNAVSEVGSDVSFVNGGFFTTTTAGGATTLTANTSAVFSAHAAASGSNALAVVRGVAQFAPVAGFVNTGSFGVNANAIGSGTSAGAAAFGYVASNTDFLSADFYNGGSMNVTAIASAPTSAYATAVGVEYNVNGATTLVATTPALLTGSFVNEGNLTVAAVALGDGGSHTVGGTTTVPNSSANAVGLLMVSGANNMVVVNSGAINVDAWTNGGPATATGILALDNGLGTGATTEVLTIINDGGSIVVRESVDGGTTFRRGMAIDVANAPNNTVINLLGDGNIYGNIDIQTGDAIAVESGTTYFDGIINPECGPPAYDGLPSLCGQGSLTIDNGGNLVLADPRVTGDPATYDGPAYVYVNEFTVGADGTITYELQPSAGGVQPIGTYPQVFAETANLDGTLVADVTTPTGLFADSYFWNNVIDAEVRNGTFDQCVLDGAYSGSLLIDFGCTYDAGNNVDLFLNRIAFDQVTGLNQNGTSVGSGLECVYDTSLTGGAANLFGDLFLITDPADYNDALNQLAGASYANYLQSFQSLGVHYNDMLDKATSCEIPALAGSVIECRASAPLHMWGQVDYQWRKADGDNEAGTMKAKRLTGMIGLDASVGSAGILGLAVGYGKNNTRDNRYGDVIKGEGWNVGAYGVFDPGTFYVKAMTNWSKFNGDSTRGVDFGIYGPALSFGGVATGSPDVNMWTLGLHGGGRVAMGANSVLTPYLNLDYVSAKLKGFTETGLDGGNLTVLSSKSKHTWLTGGVKYATQMGGVVPEVNLGYRYRMGDERSSFNAAFLGDTGCDFEVVSAAQKRGTFLVGASVGGKMGPVDLRIGYEGEFNSDITSHAGNFRIIVPLGARAAPAPAPAPVMAPPPPPAPVEEAAPPPPPPPPAPVERGERGQ